MKIGLDMDNVIYPFDDVLRSWMVKEGHGIFPPTTQWHMYEDWNMSLEEWIQHYTDSINAEFMFAEGEPIDNCDELINRLKEDGHSIHIVTHRVLGRSPAGLTETWLKKWNIPYDSLTFAGWKPIARTDVFLDDKVENVEDCLREGINGLLMDQCNNRSDSRTTQSGRIMHWGHFYDTIKVLERGE